jgi:ribosomal protein L40E
MYEMATAAPLMSVGSSAQVCSFPRCKAANPVDARFCRRCGRQLTKPASVVRERVAV